MDPIVFKLGSVRGDQITKFRYSNTFQLERTTGPDRFRIGTEEAPLSLLGKLAFLLTEPFIVLYVLHTSRCGNVVGRYQSPTMPFAAVYGFMAEFCEFLTSDARHDLWLHSPESDATLVWDRHDLIDAYGPLEQFRTVLKEHLQEGVVDGPPYPHAHMYHPEFDDAERKILRHFHWSRSPLWDSDVQLHDSSIRP